MQQIWRVFALGDQSGCAKGEYGMRVTRHKFRTFLADMAGIQRDIQICWTPKIPIIYINNPKAGTCTIKHSLKAAQADEYLRAGMTFERDERPHFSDDCLKKNGLRMSTSRHRFLISCVRNPYTRALSGYLDKVENPDGPHYRALTSQHYRALRSRQVENFEQYLLALAEYRPKSMDPHFRPQHINLGFPKATFDAIFYLENLSPLGQFLSQVSPNFRVERFAPHSRSAVTKLRDHYSDRAIELVQEIFDEDFSYFGYSRSLDDVGIVPGAFIVGDRIASTGEDVAEIVLRHPRAEPCRAIKSTLRFRQLVDNRLI